MDGEEPGFEAVKGRRRKGRPEAPPAAAPAPGGHGPGGGASSVEFQVEQRRVPWLLGAGGAAVRSLESQTGAKITVDQTSRCKGFSMVRISGPAAAVEAARELVNNSLARWRPNSGQQQDPTTAATSGTAGARDASGGANDTLAAGGATAANVSAEVQVEQRHIGWLLGSGGEMVREIEQRSGGAHLVVDQSTREQGYSTVRILGTADSAECAKGLVQQTVARHSSATAGNGEPNKAIARRDLTIEQQHVARLLGSAGSVLREIEAQSGTRIAIDQATRSQGFSSVQILGPSPEAVLAALGLVQLTCSPARAKGAAAPPAQPPPLQDQIIARVARSCLESDSEEEDLESLRSSQLEVDQYLVPWFLGKGFAALRQVERTSGAGIVIDQTTKHEGYSALFIHGDGAQVSAAREAIYDSIASFMVSPTALGAEADAELIVETRHVAWLMGTGGANVQRIEAQSGARLTIQQGQPEPGKSTVCILGGPVEAKAARMLIGASLAGRGAPDMPHNELVVEQDLVPWLLGTKGVVLKTVEERSGTKILLDQSTQSQGYSVVRILGDACQRRQAVNLIKASLEGGRKAKLKPGLSEPRPLIGVRRKRGAWRDPAKKLA